MSCVVFNMDSVRVCCYVESNVAGEPPLWFFLDKADWKQEFKIGMAFRIERPNGNPININDGIANDGLPDEAGKCTIVVERQLEAIPMTIVENYSVVRKNLELVKNRYTIGKPCRTPGRVTDKFYDR